MKLFNRVTRRVRSRDRKRTIHLAFERFEDRVLLSTFTVTNNTDGGRSTSRPAGNFWFTDDAGNKIARITPAGTFTEFPIPTANSGSFEITFGPDGNLWFTESAGN